MYDYKCLYVSVMICTSPVNTAQTEELKIMPSNMATHFLKAAQKHNRKKLSVHPSTKPTKSD